MAEFLGRYPKVNVVAHASDQNVDIVGENYDIAVKPFRSRSRIRHRVKRTELDAFAALAGLEKGESWSGLLVKTFNYNKPRSLA